MADQSVTLRNSHGDLGSRYLGATLRIDGTLTIEGQDLGDGVEEIFGSGSREYEWAWTIQPSNVQTLTNALGVAGDVLSALHDRFSGDAADGLKPFLDQHQIPYDCWTRIGD